MGPALILASIHLAQAASASATPIDRWAAAVGGREKVAAIDSMYREATIEISGAEGGIRVWRTSDGKYRKEEQLGLFSLIETFDGIQGAVQRDGGPPQAMGAAELVRARSIAFANSSAVFFAFFPERRRGTATIEDDGTIVLRPQGGLEWRVTLDPHTALPRTMVRREGGRVITVTFAAYETVEGITFEKEIHRSTGDPRFDSVIRFTKTVVNPKIEASLFSIAPAPASP